MLVTSECESECKHATLERKKCVGGCVCVCVRERERERER